MLERFVDLLGERFGDALEAVWLFGSRARGGEVSALSDIDVLVITERAGWHESAGFYAALHDAAHDVSLPQVAWTFSIQVHDARWLEDRRATGSFFVAEVERDRIDLLPAA